MARPNRNWPKRADRRPWTDAEDAALIDVFSLGICSGQTSTIFQRVVPGRRYGDILDRRDALTQAGRLTIPAPL